MTLPIMLYENVVIGRHICWFIPIFIVGPLTSISNLKIFLKWEYTATGVANKCKKSALKMVLQSQHY